MVHRREMQGQELVFGNHGALWGNAMTWWDHDTGSVWSQPLGEAIMGPRKGQRLELLSSLLTTWASWRELHPQTLALAARGSRGGFELASMAIVVELGEAATAYPVRSLRAHGVANDTVGDTPIAVVVDRRDAERWNVFSRALGRQVVALEVDERGLHDPVSGSYWDVNTGDGISGPLAVDPLARIPAFTAFPRDFRTFWPHGSFWEAAAAAP